MNDTEQILEIIGGDIEQIKKEIRKQTTAQERIAAALEKWNDATIQENRAYIQSVVCGQ